MKAIVLTCERYFPFMAHMVKSYEAVWPQHPFTFVCPCEGSPRQWALEYPGINFVPSPREIRNCVLSLIADLPDGEWVYWCIDDKYPIALNVDAAEKVLAYVTNTADENVCGVSFARSRNLVLKQNLFDNESLDISESIKGLRRRYYWQIWYHQFLRVGVIRRLFKGFPDRDFAAREMDAFISGLDVPKDQGLYVTSKNYASFGESTLYGKTTKNCAEHMESFGLSVPDNFPMSDWRDEMGKRPMLLEKFIYHCLSVRSISPAMRSALYYKNRLKNIIVGNG